MKTRGDSGREQDAFDVDRPSRAVTSKSDSWVLETNRGQDEGGRQEVSTDRPAPAVSTKAGSQWVVRTGVNTSDGDERYERPVDEPAPSVTTRGDNWKLTQKATGQNGSRSRSRGADEPSLPIALGHNSAAWCWEQDASGAIRVELHELAALQDMPDGYPFVGNKTSVARQIGNIVPPSLAEHVIRALTADP